MIGQKFWGSVTRERSIHIGQAFGPLEDRVVPAASPIAAISGVVAGDILDTKVIAYDVTTTGTLSVNLRTGTYSAAAELAGGVKLDTAALKTLLNGQFALPKVEPIQAVTAFAGLKTNVVSDYDTVRANLYKQYGAGQAYVSSLRFADWASPENAASTAATAVVTAGATTAQVVQEAKEVLTAELGNIYTWLKSRAPAEAEKFLGTAFKAIVTGKSVESPYFAIKAVNIRETYTIGLGGTAATIAAGLGVGSPAKTITSVHHGFVIVWKGAVANPLTAALNSYKGPDLSGTTAFAGALSKLAKLPELKALGPVAQAVLTQDASAAVDQLVIGKLTAALGVTPAQLKGAFKPGSPIVDLTRTDLGSKLSGLLGNLAVGNEGSVQVTKLELNLTSFEVTATVKIRARQSWGSVGEILQNVGKTVGVWVDKAGNAVQQATDAVGNTIRKVAYKAASVVTDVFDRAGSLITRTIVNAAGIKTLEQQFVAGVMTLENSYNSAGQKLSTYFQSGNRFIYQAYTDGVVTLERQYEAGRQVVEAAWANGVNTLYKKWDTAGNAISSYFQSGTRFVYQEFTRGIATLERQYEAGRQVVEAAWANGVNTLYKKWDTAGNAVSSYFQSGGRFVYQEFTRGVVTLERQYEAGRQVVEAAWANGVNTFYQTWDTAGKTVSVYWRDGAKQVREYYQNGVRVAQNVWENGVNVAQHVWNSAGTYVGNALSNAGNTAKDWLGKIGISL